MSVTFSIGVRVTDDEPSLNLDQPERCRPPRLARPAYRRPLRSNART